MSAKALNPMTRPTINATLLPLELVDASLLALAAAADVVIVEEIWTVMRLASTPKVSASCERSLPTTKMHGCVAAQHVPAELLSVRFPTFRSSGVLSWQWS